MVNGPLYLILQASKQTNHFYRFWLLPKLANSKREKWYKNGPFWVLFWLDLPLQGLLGSYWVTHRWAHYLPLIRAQLCQDWSRGAWDNWLKGGSIIHRKWDKNDKKRLKNWRDHLISHTQTLYNQFYKSTTPFHSFWASFLLSNAANSRQENKREK